MDFWKVISDTGQAKNTISLFLLINCCVWILVVLSKKWMKSPDEAGSSIPDLEKPTRQPAREKLARKLGGMYDASMKIDSAKSTF